MESSFPVLAIRQQIGRTENTGCKLPGFLVMHVWDGKMAGTGTGLQRSTRWKAWGGAATWAGHVAAEGREVTAWE